ncbi:MAG: response regulator [Burkholderiaceae bacterium]
MPSSAAIAPRYRVLIVDDHAIVRAGLRQLIDSDSAFLVTAEASTAAQAMHHLRTGDIDVMLLDIALPDRNGLDLLKQIKPMTPTLKVLVCSPHQEEAYGLRALRAGAAGYVSKQAMPNVMLNALHHIAAGKKYISDELAQQLAERIDDEQAWLPHQKLSDREYQTLLSIAAGMTVTEIATQLALSSKTISMYRTRLLQKMRMRNNAELMHYVICNQLLPALAT